MKTFFNHQKLGPCVVPEPRTPIVFMGQTTRRFGPHVSTIEQFWERKNRFLWKCSGFSCEIFAKEYDVRPDGTRYIFHEDGEDRPIRFWYPGTIIITLCPISSSIYVLGDNGGSMAMTNVWREGKFCIGQAIIERFDFSVPDIIIYATPNKDLGWHIPGRPIIATPSDPYPIITSWPQSHSRTDFPWPKADANAP